MGFTLSVNGSESLFYGEDTVRMVHTASSSPSESKAKSTNGYFTVWINGKLNVNKESTLDSATLQLFQWAQVPASQDDAYREVIVEVVSAGVRFRKVKLTKAFVVNYSERYADQIGVGSFTLVVRQKADKIYDLEVDGGQAVPG